MSIKSDRWIRRMAREHGMIEPFAAEQVRAVDGHKIVSYGTSSYGYDVRCAPEFKIFTNINSTIVDPKAFDEKSFVDFPGDVCIIPPNSFALARTVEYFRIPRSVLTVCLGKCVTGDARVVDAQTGAYVPITEMRFGRCTLALDGGQLKRARVSAFVPQGKKAVFKLTTRAGLQIRATANHPFLMRRGWVPLEQLRAGDRIAVAREIPFFGSTALPDWEATLLGLTVAAGCCNTPAKNATYMAADSALLQLLADAVSQAGFAEVACAGRYRYRLVDRKGRGGPTAANRARCWLEKYGLDAGAGAKSVPQAVFTAPAHAVRLFLQALLSGAGGLGVTDGGALLEYRSKSRRLIEDVHHLLLRFGIFSRMREDARGIGTSDSTIQITEPAAIERFASLVGLVQGSARQQRLARAVANMIRAPSRGDFGTARSGAWQPLQVAAGRTGIIVRGFGSQESEECLSVAAARAGATPVEARHRQVLPQGPLWDAVEAIEPAGVEEVFDISVPQLHNFVANGLIVHNSTYARCGIICNVTPLEPEWEGHVTLEFSNTTPLPAKIYAHEGVAQMLFFESDELCETSYRDRGGKYMGQKGVTLPKA